ncbi:MAG: LLM class F420-dependent oxidoreductase [Actinobacteria bacterium]|nr:LLM class F420-dependent oxidoreductase [Actinomycetota bacterium]
MASGPVGVTFASLQALGPSAALDVAARAEGLGYSSFWTAEVTGPEAFSLLSAVGVVAPTLGLGTGVLALQLRTPPLLAMAGATLQAMAPDRDVFLGVGISSPVVAGRWHGAHYGDRPLAQVREFVSLLRACLSGERVDHEGDFYNVSRFQLGVRLGDRRPKIVIGALNEGMLRLAGEVADGVLLNYLPATHVPWSVEQVRKGGDATIYSYVHVGVCDRAAGVDLARRDLFSYAVVDAYANNFARAGYGESVAAVRERHAARDRDGALAAVSDAMIDGIDVMGDAQHVRATVDAYRHNGVDVPIIFPLPWGADRLEIVQQTLEAAAPDPA